MNWLNFSLFVLLYAASCIPMYAAGRTEDLRTKTMHCIVDGVLSITALIYLWYAFPSTLFSISALFGFLALNGYVGVWVRGRGYDPYAAISRREVSK